MKTSLSCNILSLPSILRSFPYEAFGGVVYPLRRERGKKERKKRHGPCTPPTIPQYDKKFVIFNQGVDFSKFMRGRSRKSSEQQPKQ